MARKSNQINFQPTAEVRAGIERFIEKQAVRPSMTAVINALITMGLNTHEGATGNG